MDERDCVGWWDAYTFFSSSQDEERFEFADSLRDFIALGENLAAAAEGVGLDSSVLIQFLHLTQDIYYNVARHLTQADQAPVRFPVADTSLRVWMDRLRFRLRNENTTLPPSLSASPSSATVGPSTSVPSLPAPATPAPSPSVVLKAQHDDVYVNGVRKPPLPAARYKVIKALLAVWPGSLTKDQLEQQSGCGDARGVLTRLSLSDPDWRKVIIMAQQKGMGYRLA